MQAATNIEASKITPTGTYLTASHGKTRADVAIKPDGVVYVVSLNAAHQVWRGMGRRFNTITDAIAGYKSAGMKSILQAAADLTA